MSASAGADPMASGVENLLGSAPESSMAFLATPLPTDQRDPVHLVSSLLHPDSVLAAPSASLVGGRLGHPREHRLNVFS